MAGKVYKKIRVVGCSEKNFEDAVSSAVKTASKTLKGLSWFEVAELRGAIKNGKVLEYQATVDLAFKLE